MFTGIVTDVGQVRHIEQRGDTHIVIATHYDVARIDLGASIACSGACMTVTDKGTRDGENWFAFSASGETLSKTTLGDWTVGTKINLERAMRLGDELGGHIVTGHVDGVAEIVSVTPEGESVRVELDAPPVHGQRHRLALRYYSSSPSLDGSFASRRRRLLIGALTAALPLSYF